MKKSELVTLIKELTRPIIKEELNKLLLETVLSNKQTSINKSEQQKKSLNTITEIKKQPAKQFAKNPLINSILNDTATSLTTQKPQSTTNLRQKYSSLMTESDNSLVIPEMDVDVENLPEHITDALTRDYSEIVKRFDKK